jgi:hypothetical protein
MEKSYLRHLVVLHLPLSRADTEVDRPVVRVRVTVAHGVADADISVGAVEDLVTVDVVELHPVGHDILRHRAGADVLAHARPRPADIAGPLCPPDSIAPIGATMIEEVILSHVAAMGARRHGELRRSLRCHITTTLAPQPVDLIDHRQLQ